MNKKTYFLRQRIRLFASTPVPNSREIRPVKLGESASTFWLFCERIASGVMAP